MAKIHIPGDGHVVPLPNSGFQWLAYSNAHKKRVVEQALFILRHNVRGMKPCNKCFSKLPGGQTFDDVLDDPNIAISFDPQKTQGTFGATLGNDITITDFSIRIGRWTVAATLVHELAHVNGAPGNNHQAEATLLCCGLSALEDPNIIGAAESPSGNRYG
jgi:hypothetical protein